MHDITDVLTGQNFWLLALAVGVTVWVVRQVLPVGLEAVRVGRAALRIGPTLLGGALAVIPELRPVADNLAASVLWGVIAGSISQTAYGTLRQLLPEKIRLLIGSRAERRSLPPPQQGPDDGPV